MVPLELQSPMNYSTASEMRGHVQVPFHLLRGQHAEQQAEGHPERLEAQPVSRQRAGPFECGKACCSVKAQRQFLSLGYLSDTHGILRTKCHAPTGGLCSCDSWFYTELLGGADLVIALGMFEH